MQNAVNSASPTFPAASLAVAARSPVIGGNKLDCGDFLFLGHIRSPFCVGVSFTPTHVLQGLPRRVIVAKIRIKSIGVGLSATVFPNLQQALD